MRSRAMPGWPLSGLVTWVPALVIAGVSLIYALRPTAWAYIDLSMFGGLARESLGFTGPFVSCVAAVVAFLYIRPVYPFSSPLVFHGRGWLQFRLLWVVGLVWGTAFITPFVVGSVIYSNLATGGRVYYAEYIISLLSLWFFVSSGFALGVMLPKWYSVLAAPFWGVLCGHYVPMVYSMLFGHSSRTNIEYFLFPSLQAGRYTDLVSSVMWMIIACWVLLDVSIVFLVVAVARWRSLERGPLTLGCFLLLIVALLGWGALVQSERSPFSREAVPEMVCVVSEMGARVCGLGKQLGALQDIAAVGDGFYARLGGVPEPMATLASSELYMFREELLAETPYPVVFSDPIYPGRVDYQFREELAMSFGGIEECDYGGGGPYVDHWPLAIAGWLLGDYTEDSPVLLSEYLPLLESLHDENVREWYWENAAAIASCRVSEGPS